MESVTAWVRTVLLLAVSGCSGTSITNVTPGSGGIANQSSTAGGTSSGSTTTVGGASVSTPAGGVTSSVTVQTAVSGGSSPAGGAHSTGGFNAGGLDNAGGAGATGGTGASSGGLNSFSGGSGNAGGSATGGTSTATGGSTSALSGGASSTGGTSALTGGASGTGGTSAATGGVSSTGGTSMGTGLLASCALLFHMDEAAWNSTLGEVRDASGAGNNGTAMIGANTGSAAKFGRAGLFGGEGYVSVTSSNSLHVMGAFSIAAWFYPTFLDGTTRAPGIVAKRWAWNDSSEFALFLGEENRLWVDIMTDDNRFSSATVFNMAEWYHVAVVFDGSLAADKRVSVYVNGQLDIAGAESSSVVVPYDSPLEVGRLRDGGQGFIGSIDEVALWQRALSAAEVLSIYERTSPL